MEQVGLFEPSVALQPHPKYRTRKVQLVLIAGKGGSGKTTAARHLLNTLSMYNNLSVVISPLAVPITLVARD